MTLKQKILFKILSIFTKAKSKIQNNENKDLPKYIYTKNLFNLAGNKKGPNEIHKISSMEDFYNFFGHKILPNHYFVKRDIDFAVPYKKIEDELNKILKYNIELDSLCIARKIASNEPKYKFIYESGRIHPLRSISLDDYEKIELYNVEYSRLYSEVYKEYSLANLFHYNDIGSRMLRNILMQPQSNHELYCEKSDIEKMIKIPLEFNNFFDIRVNIRKREEKFNKTDSVSLHTLPTKCESYHNYTFMGTPNIISSERENEDNTNGINSLAKFVTETPQKIIVDPEFVSKEIHKRNEIVNKDRPILFNRYYDPVDKCIKVNKDED